MCLNCNIKIIIFSMMLSGLTVTNLYLYQSCNVYFNNQTRHLVSSFNIIHCTHIRRHISIIGRKCKRYHRISVNVCDFLVTNSCLPTRFTLYIQYQQLFDICLDFILVASFTSIHVSFKRNTTQYPGSDIKLTACAKVIYNILH